MKKRTRNGLIFLASIGLVATLATTMFKGSQTETKAPRMAEESQNQIIDIEKEIVMEDFQDPDIKSKIIALVNQMDEEGYYVDDIDIVNQKVVVEVERGSPPYDYSAKKVLESYEKEVQEYLLGDD